ncbi:MAG: nucleotidyl transferase AbiEii/AbiGii toxin family protein [Kiritimatiellia bacterium]
MAAQEDIIRDAVRLLAERCPRLVSLCYWAGTSAIAGEDLRHRQSFDLDFHTCKALQDVRPILAEIQKTFAKNFEIVQVPDEYGSAFQGVLRLPGGERITIEVRANYEDVPDSDLVFSRAAARMRRVSVSKYLADKIQCVVERAEARDLVDIFALLKKHPDMEEKAKALLAEQDAVTLAERLLAWTDNALEKDLAAYADVRFADAAIARDRLLAWVKAAAGKAGAGG